MKYLLAAAVFLASAFFPLALKGQSVVLASSSNATDSWMRPEPFPNGPSGFRRFSGYPTVVFPPFFGYPSNYPFAYFYPTLWPPLDVEYQQASRIAHGDVEAEVASQEKAYLSSQVQALTDEVHSLREQHAMRPYAQSTAAPPGAELPSQPSPRGFAGAQQKFPATVFIYRDGHEMEVRDYAIFGQTLWVFNGQTTHKFPLADFNIAASRHVNEQHGVEFPLSIQPRQ
jgi:hypothetical protein